MKGIFVILDGVADLPCQQLSQKTPLEAAKTPNLDYFASHSSIYKCYTVRKGVAPQSSAAVVSLLGSDPSLAQRGSLEALGAGIQLKNGDLAFRTNFATIDDLENLEILDRRAGRTLTTKEAMKLAKIINEKVKLHYKFEFKPTIQHRGVLIFRGGFSDNITNIDPEYANGSVSSNSGNKIKFSHAMDDEDDSKLSAEVLNNFVRQSHDLLDKNPINQKKSKKGIYSANFLLCRDPGNSPPKLNKLKGKWMALAYMPLEIGIARAANMQLQKFKYPSLRKTDVYANLHAGLKKASKVAIKTIKKYKNDYDYFYIHFKETDIPGHDNKPEEKIKMIEFLDNTFFSFLRRIVRQEKVIVTADHTTACNHRAHTSDPVPLMVFPSGEKREKRYTEQAAKDSKEILGAKVLEKLFFE